MANADKCEAELSSALFAIVERLEEGYRDQAESDARALVAAGVGTWASLVAEASNDKPLEQRKIALWFLARLMDARAAEPLLQALADDSPEIRAEAARDLGVLRDESAIAPLVTALEGDPDAKVRAAAASSLGTFLSPASTDALLRSLQRTEEDAEVRGVAAEGLATLGNEKAVYPLINALTDCAVEVRFWAAFALGEIGDSSALPALRHLAETDEASLPGWWSVREEAERAIESIESAGASSTGEPPSSEVE